MHSERIILEKTRNTRTFSSMKNKNGQVIYNNLLIRSDDLTKLSINDIEVLKNKYQLKRVIDLRCENEITDNPDLEIAGVEYIINPILPKERVGISKKGDAKRDFEDFVKEVCQNGLESSKNYMKEIYKELIITDFSKQAYGNFLNILSEDVHGATLWHCSAGKDRAGFATILVLYILDFDLADILEDYLSTNLHYQKQISEFVSKYGEEFRSTIENVFGVEEEYFEIMMQCINEEYGSMDSFIEVGLGFSKDKQEKLKKLYLRN